MQSYFFFPIPLPELRSSLGIARVPRHPSSASTEATNPTAPQSSNRLELGPTSLGLMILLRSRSNDIIPEGSGMVSLAPGPSRSHTVWEGPKRAQEGRGGLQEGLKMAPDCSHRAPRGPLGAFPGFMILLRPRPNDIILEGSCMISLGRGPQRYHTAWGGPTGPRRVPRGALPGPFRGPHCKG